MTNIRLLVLRTGDIKGLAEFYRLFGLEFEYHQHGNSPFHYSTMLGQTVLEIYPLTKSQTEPDKNLRIGFGIDNFEEAIQQLRQLSVTFSVEPAETDFGFMAVIIDPDGRKIELYRNEQR